ncbi:hypothetical protein ES702_02660 [subsurface metagenome]
MRSFQSQRRVMSLDRWGETEIHCPFMAEAELEELTLDFCARWLFHTAIFKLIDTDMSLNTLRLPHRGHGAARVGRSC